LKILFVSLLILLSISVSAQYRGYSMYLYTYPNSLIADGKSSCTISAEIYDNDGNKVKDGVRVDFSTTLGNITAYAMTSGGVARATLRSAHSEGVAIVNASISSYGVTARTNIDFLAPGTEIVKDTFLAIESNTYLGYDSDSRVIDTVGGFVAKYKGVTFEGYECQINCLANNVKMRANMGEYFKIKKQNKELLFSELYFNISDGKGYGYLLEKDNSKLVSIRLSDLKCEDIEFLPSNISFDIVPIEDSSVYVTGKLFILDPKKELKVKSPTIYVAERKLVNIPFIRIDVRDANGVFGTPIAVGTNGLKVNLPIYYSLSKNGSANVRVQKDASTSGSFSSNDAWRVDLENEYGTGTDSFGTFKATSVTNDWGLRLNNTTKFNDSGTFRGSIDYPNHQNVYTNLDYSQDLSYFYYSVSARATNYKDKKDNYYTSAYIQTQSRPVFKLNSLNYNISDQFYYDTSLADSASYFGSKLGLDLFTNSIKYGNFEVNANSSYYQRFQKGYNGYSTSFNINGNMSFSNYGYLGLHYSYLLEKFNEDYTNSYVSCDFGLGNDLLRLSGNGMYNLEDDSYNLYGEVGVYPIPTWAVKFFTTYQVYGEDDYLDYKISLSKQIGFTEARLVWSKSRNRIDLEIGNLGF